MTDPLKNVGYFKELHHGDPNGPSLREAVRAKAAPAEDRLAAYLKQGGVLATTGSTVSDVLSDDDAPIARLEILTDGEWNWPADLAYYVERYHVRLPEEFVEHVASRDWSPPALSDDDLAALADRMAPA